MKSKTRAIFRHLYQVNAWGSTESVSGTGSTLEETKHLREALPKLLVQYKIRSMLDIPCGDYNWMRHVRLDIPYTGADIVPEVILTNQQHADAQHTFVVLDLITDELPKADLILCRDCLFHLPLNDAIRAINSMKRSGAIFLLTTTFPNWSGNRNVRAGDWYPINLQKPPFNFPAPIEVIREGVLTGDFSEKSLCLWRLADIDVRKSLLHPITYGRFSPRTTRTGQESQ